MEAAVCQKLRSSEASRMGGLFVSGPRNLAGKEVSMPGFFRQKFTALVHTAAAVGASGDDNGAAEALGLIVGINITAITGTTPTLTVIVEGKDPSTGTYYTVLSSAALNAAGYTELIVYPGVTAAANVAVSRPIPITWRIRTVIGGTTPAVTATVSAQTVT